MGFDLNGAKLLIKARQLNVDFSEVITVGRQGMHLKEKELKKLLSKAGITNLGQQNIITNNKYAEPFLNLLGAKITDSIDASTYEKATLIHDLNLPIPNQFKSKYSLLIDGGSMEHVFNFPVAIKNCMQLIKKGGYYIGITPTNNFFGHGFYQFSPELYYRVFSEANGFQVMKMYFYIDKKNSAVYEIKDPLEVKQRVTMVNSFPSYLFVIAKKTEEKEIFEKIPQQSDYEHTAWETNLNNEERSAQKTKSKQIKHLIPLNVRIKIMELLGLPKKLSDRFKCYTKATGISNSQFISKSEDLEK